MLDKWYIFEDYACGKVTMLCESGMFAIPLKDVKYMQPSKPKMKLFDKKYQEVLKKLLDIKEDMNEMDKT